MRKLKIFLTLSLALLVNTAMGGVLAGAVGFAPYLGAITLNAASLAMYNVLPSGSFAAGVYTEVWTGEMIKAFRNSVESLGWYNLIRDYSRYANNDVIHFVDLGGDPDVLINNTTYPIDVQTITDADKAISLDKYQTKATPITDDELHAISYDKMGSVIERHREAIDEKKYSKALHSLAPNSNAAKTPVIATTGNNDEGGVRKMLTRKNIISLKKKFDAMKVPVRGRVLVLCPDHVADLLDTDQKFAAQYYNYTTGKIADLYGFQVFEYADSPYYTTADKTKVAFGGATTGALQASVAFFAPRMMKATGNTFAYLSEAKTDPKTQQNLCNFRHYSICLPLKNEAIGAIVSAAAA